MSTYTASRFSSRSVYKRIFHYTKNYKNLFYLSIFLAISIALISPIRPFLIKYTIDTPVRQGSNNTDPNTLQHFTNVLIWILILQVALLFVDALIRFLFSYVMASVGLGVVKDIRKEVYQKILRLKMSVFDSTPIGQFTTRCVNDAEVMNNIFSEGFVPILADILSIIIIIFVMFYVDWQVAFIALIPVPLVLTGSYFLKKSVTVSFQKVRSTIGKLNAFIQEHLQNIGIIQIFNIEEKEFQKFKKINAEHRDANINAIFAYSVFYPIIEIVAAIGLSFLLFFSLNLNIDPAKIIFYFLSINQIFRPLRFIADRFNTIQMGLVASKRVFQVLDNPNVITNKPDALKNYTLQGNITFSNVSFGYQSDNYILKNITLHIRAKEKIALVGPTGNGKTSIINLINRLYEHQKGQILIDNIPIENIHLDTLRKQITIIPQNIFLFSGTIYKNITLDNKDISEQDVINATRLLGLHETIINMPNAYQHHISEYGNNLSTGQKQLICFARALVFKTKILIMDEATSSIDNETENRLQNALRILAKDRTTIVIAHRLSTIKESDKILFIENGQVAESGNHNKLLARKGKYYMLYQARKLSST